LQAAKAAGIPVLTWDSDVLPDSKGLRAAYIGTHNYEIGANLAKLAMEIKPKGGTVCIQSGGALRPTTMNVCRVFATIVGQEIGRFSRRPLDRPEWLDRDSGLSALYQ
jgi:ABC-type sugar transport system, periplasmic component